MKQVVIMILLFLTLSQCRNGEGEFLFEMDYPNNRATLNLTLGLSTGYVATFGPLNTNLDELLMAAGVQKEDVSLIQSVSAEVTSIDGIDLDFIDELRLILCRPEEPGNCTIEMFHLDRIPFSIDRTIRLQPGITNLKDFLIDQRQFIVELELTRLRDFPIERDLRLRLDFNLEVRQ